MYEVKIGRAISFIFHTAKESFALAVSSAAQGYEVDVISTLTGEVIFSYRDGEPPYIASCVVMAL